MDINVLKGDVGVLGIADEATASIVIDGWIDGASSGDTTGTPAAGTDSVVGGELDSFNVNISR